MPPFRDHRSCYSAIPSERRARHVPGGVFYPVNVSASAGWTNHRSLPMEEHRAQRVPLPVGNTSIQRPYFAVRFRNLREHGDSKGVHLADLFQPESEPVALAGAADVVLEELGLGGDEKELKFVIYWPGYEPERSTLSTVLENGGPLTRRELARRIMYAYGKFFGKVVKEGIVPRHAGVFDIALYQGEESRPDGVGVHLSQLHLVNLREPLPGDDHWVAEVDVVWW